LTKFIVQADFTVHSVGLSVNSVGLSAKSAGWGFHCSNFESNEFWPVFTEFDRFFQKPAGSEGADFLVSAGFLNTEQHTWGAQINFSIEEQQEYNRSTEVTARTPSFLIGMKNRFLAHLL
jgi:hypothetical protein